ncbi:hypothetical protein BJ968_004480 [Kineococcus aurantiacus]|uniref:Uncharacterized protein n=1 Tax=Kineococcus aurantiacus TaxID=37633 RepID=A0A7Y9DQI1_9ACTN|nr:hypothetical protein [Kineococcus aurantiacus]
MTLRSRPVPFRVVEVGTGAAATGKQGVGTGARRGRLPWSRNSDVDR